MHVHIILESNLFSFVSCEGKGKLEEEKKKKKKENIKVLAYFPNETSQSPYGICFVCLFICLFFLC